MNDIRLANLETIEREYFREHWGINFQDKK